MKLYTVHLGTALLAVATADHAREIADLVPGAIMALLPGYTLSAAARLVREADRDTARTGVKAVPTNYPRYAQRPRLGTAEAVEAFMRDIRGRLVELGGTATLGKLCRSDTEWWRVRQHIGKPGAVSRWLMAAEWRGETLYRTSRVELVVRGGAS